MYLPRDVNIVSEDYCQDDCYVILKALHLTSLCLPQVSIMIFNMILWST